MHKKPEKEENSSVFAPEQDARRYAELVDRFADKVFHLTSIMSLDCERLKRNLASGEFDAETINQIVDDLGDAKNRIERISNQVVYAARSRCARQDMQPEAVELCEYLRLCFTAQERVKQVAGIEMKLELPEEKVYVKADRTYLECIVANLLSNALRACAVGGCVTAKVERQEENVLLSVADNGCGMTAEQRKNAFILGAVGCEEERFWDGAGLGLHLCAQYADAMGWEITLHDAAPGTVARLKIPPTERNEPLMLYSNDVARSAWASYTRGVMLRELRCVPGLEKL